MLKKLVTVLEAGVLLFVSVHLAEATPIITTGLIAAYEFSGNANDSSGNGNHGVVSGATLTADRFGNSNSAYSFDGNNDGIYVFDTDNELAPPTLTISAWFRFTGLFDSGGGVVIAYKGNYDPMPHMAYSLEIQKSSKQLSGRSDTAALYHNVLSVNPISNNEWHHTAYVIDESVGKAYLYLDGILQDVNTLTGTVNQTGEPLSIGRYYYNNLYDFSGVIDDLYIYDHALSSSEVTALYTGVLSVPEPATLVLFGIGIAVLASKRSRSGVARRAG
ncbi:MAG: PEP-CTERM sorting domain-containing protein [Gammaproteobacteria bacterium]|nr:PEP-CTERM sorting domain-containing protein [Gammaproteobacteria bacterium]